MSASVSLTEALKVGVDIEQIDIADIDAKSSEAEDASVLRVLENLRAGSTRHLSAFFHELDSHDLETEYRSEYQPSSALSVFGNGRKKGR